MQLFSTYLFKPLFFLLAFFLSSCISSKHTAITGYDYRKLTTHQEKQTFEISSVEYKKIAKGIFIARIENHFLPLIATIAKIDLKEKQLKIYIVVRKIL